MDLLSRLADPFLAKAERARNRPLLEAAMASAALAATAEGDDQVSFAKRLALDQVLDGVPALRAFDAHGAVRQFNRFIEDIRANPEHGRARALMALSSCAGNGETAALLVRIARAMALAEGPASPRASVELENMAAALGLAGPDLGAPRAPEAADAGTRPFVIVVGNEKGGTGKSTTALHLAVALLKRGHQVGSIDLDSRQGTLSRYLANRAAFAQTSARPVPMPRHCAVAESTARDREAARAEEALRLESALAELAECRFVVIDTPGSGAALSRLGHGHADVLITPLNDSFLDLDVLARIDRERREVLEPSPYARMVWEQSKARRARGRAAIDWVVMRNRLAHIDARNSREMGGLLARLAERMRFRLQHGLSERVVFRELFYRGLSLLDLPDAAGERPHASHAHARREVEDLIEALRLPETAAGESAALAEAPA